ncbi:MAG TPA: glycine cleavage system protein GcvH [Polyangiaceae bacterium]|jgi:glycine cleavage system H protein|nr:glycine cleavage system protein GcvH [Polyangiaceae bacterium]
MADNEVRSDRRYTKDHEWAKEEGKALRVGITSFAVDQLGDITLVNIDVKPGDTLTAGRAFGTIESVKTLSDLFAPVTGRVEAVNTELDTKPEIINEDCYEKGWMIKITPSDADEVSSLLDATAYKDLLSTSAH